MAVTSTLITPTTAILGARGLRAGRRGFEIYGVTKLTGDTTATITSSALKEITDVQVTSLADVDVAAVGVVTNAAAGASVALTALGAGTSLIVLLKGSKK